MRDIFFFQCRTFFASGIFLQDIFLHRNQSARYFFSEITHTPLLKVKWSGKVSQLFLSPILDLLAVTILPLEI